MSTLLSRTWKFSCSAALILNFTYQTFIRINQYSSQPICQATPFASWVHIARSLESGAFLSKLVVLFYHYIFHRRSGHLHLSTVATSVTITTIAFTSSFFTVVDDWGGVCVDAFGIKSPAAQAGEWMSTVPLLFYAVISIANKSTPTKIEVIILSCITIAMICTFLIVLPIPYGLACFLLSFGILLAAIAGILMIRSCFMDTLRTMAYTESIPNSSFGDSDLEGLYIKRRRLAVALGLLLPPFPIIYFLGLSQALNEDTTAVLFIICNVAAKLFFITIALESHVEVLQQALLREQQYAISARNEFLRYIMHEVRVPLNSISMCADVLINPFTPKDTFIKNAFEVRKAVRFMENTLNGVVKFHSLESNHIILSPSCFTIKNLIKAVTHSLRRLWADKFIDLYISISTTVPINIVSDVIQLEYILMTYVSNAIQHSPPQSKIRIRAFLDTTCTIDANQLTALFNKSGRPYRCRRVVQLVFEVTDSGPGLSGADARVVFKPFSKLRTNNGDEESATSDKGYALSICKRIANEMGAIVSCRPIAKRKGSGGEKISVNGCVFSLSVTVAVPAENDVQNLTQPMTNTSSGGGKRISTRDAHAVAVAITDQMIDIDKNNKREDSKLEGFAEEEEEEIGEAAFGEFKMNGLPRSLCYTSSLARDDITSSSPRSNITNENFPCSRLRIRSMSSNSNGSFSDIPDAINPSSHTTSISEAVARTSGVVVAPVMGATSTLNASSSSDSISGRDYVLKRSEVFLKPKMALVVDDVATNRKMLANAIKKHGIDSDFATDGVEAVEAVQLNPAKFDLIFMDFTMHIMNGAEATKHIRTNGFSRMIIGVTANVLDDDVHTFLVSGVDLVITKPMRSEYLIQLLEYVTENGNKKLINKKLCIRNGQLEEMPWMI